MPACSSCNAERPRSAFTNAQLKKQAGSRCKDCVSSDAANTSQQPDATPPPPSPTFDAKAIQDKAVRDVAAAMRKQDPALAEAFLRPAMKTAPANFSSIQAAEAAGWTWNGGLGRWEPPQEEVDALREMETFAKTLTDSRVGTMSVKELQSALTELCSSAVPSADQAALRLQVTEVAASVHRKARTVRKQNTYESVRSGGSIRECVCTACSKPAGLGTSLLKCARCMVVAYCDTECQTAHWAEHKKMCKVHRQMRAEVNADGVTDTSKHNDAMAWYGSVPNLAEGVVCAAWKHRRKSPWFQVQGGVNSRLAQMSMITREIWSQLPPGQDLNFGARFAQADFNPDVHYFVCLSAGHAGTESWPCPNPRMRFPFPPEQMDAFVAASEERREAKRHEEATHEESNPWVQLKGLSTQSLNGARGIRGAWDAEKGRWGVQLKSGKEVSVKPANLEEVLSGKLDSSGLE